MKSTSYNVRALSLTSAELKKQQQQQQQLYSTIMGSNGGTKVSSSSSASSPHKQQQQQQQQQYLQSKDHQFIVNVDDTLTSHGIESSSFENSSSQSLIDSNRKRYNHNHHSNSNSTNNNRSELFLKHHIYALNDNYDLKGGKNPRNQNINHHPNQQQSTTSTVASSDTKQMMMLRLPQKNSKKEGDKLNNDDDDDDDASTSSTLHDDDDSTTTSGGFGVGEDLNHYNNNNNNCKQSTTNQKHLNNNKNKRIMNEIKTTKTKRQKEDSLNEMTLTTTSSTTTGSNHDHVNNRNNKSHRKAPTASSTAVNLFCLSSKQFDSKAVYSYYLIHQYLIYIIMFGIILGTSFGFYYFQMTINLKLELLEKRLSNQINENLPIRLISSNDLTLNKHQQQKDDLPWLILNDQNGGGEDSDKNNKPFIKSLKKNSNINNGDYFVLKRLNSTSYFIYAAAFESNNNNNNQLLNISSEQYCSNLDEYCSNQLVRNVVISEQSIQMLLMALKKAQKEKEEELTTTSTSSSTIKTTTTEIDHNLSFKTKELDVESQEVEEEFEEFEEIKGNEKLKPIIESKMLDKTTSTSTTTTTTTTTTLPTTTSTTTTSTSTTTELMTTKFDMARKLNSDLTEQLSFELERNNNNNNNNNNRIKKKNRKNKKSKANNNVTSSSNNNSKARHRKRLENELLLANNKNQHHRKLKNKCNIEFIGPDAQHVTFMGVFHCSWMTNIKETNNRKQQQLISIKSSSDNDYDDDESNDDHDQQTENENNNYYFTKSYKGSSLTMCSSLNELKMNRCYRNLPLQYSYYGTGNVIYKNYFIYHQDTTRKLVIHSIENSNHINLVDLPDDAACCDRDRDQLYSVKNAGFVDFEVDENGLWMIYKLDRSRIDTKATTTTTTKEGEEEMFDIYVIAKVNETTNDDDNDFRSLSIERKWYLRLRRENVANMIIVCGQVYALRNTLSNPALIYKLCDLFNENDSCSTKSYDSEQFNINISSRQLTAMSYNREKHLIYMVDAGSFVYYQLKLNNNNNNNNNNETQISNEKKRFYQYF